jgi:hypothetical protein
MRVAKQKRQRRSLEQILTDYRCTTKDSLNPYRHRPRSGSFSKWNAGMQRFKTLKYPAGLFEYCMENDIHKLPTSFLRLKCIGERSLIDDMRKKIEYRKEQHQNEIAILTVRHQQAIANAEQALQSEIQRQAANEKLLQDRESQDRALRRQKEAESDGSPGPATSRAAIEFEERHRAIRDGETYLEIGARRKP